MTEQGTKKGKNRRRGRKSGEKSKVGDSVSDNLDDSISNYQAHKTPLIQLNEDAPTWYEYGKDFPGRNDTSFANPPNQSDQSNNSLVAKYRSIGDIIFQKEIQLVGRNSTRGSDERWVENTMKKGTLKDRIAAMSVTVSSDPIHKFYALDGLLSMVGCSESGGKTNSRVAQLTAEALEDLFINTFLPPDRKLLTMAQRPLYRYETSKDGKKSKKTLSPRILLLWRFEEMVKEKYELFLTKYMANALQESADMQKISTLHLAATLLRSVPEGEAQLLALMVNKLGDPGKKTAAAAGHQLRSVLQHHPNMQLVIAREVQQLAHRPHLSPKALYNCIVFLNQLKLEKKGDDRKKPTSLSDSTTLPASLIKTYFRLFEVAVKKGKKDHESEEIGMKSRLLSALLAGVNRAHPYLPEQDQGMEEHIDSLYRVVHTAPPAACTQSLMLLFHLVVGSKLGEEQPEEPKTDTQNNRQDRFYRALYATLSKPALVSHGKHLTMYFNLLYKAMKYDTDIDRVNAFAKRIMCTILHSHSAPIAGSLFLLNEISKTHGGLRACIEEVPGESDANLILDDTKREPRAALVFWDKEDNDDNSRTRRPPSWELSLVSHHFHPSVAKFAKSMGSIEYAGDPLKDFGLAPFLDKFAYRNPKSRDKLASHYKRGQSIAERRAGTDGMMRARLELPMNDPSFLEREDVNEQDEFFRKFFVERARRDEIKGIIRGKKESLDDKERLEAEEGALDAAEEAEGMDNGKSFEEYERAWDTDEEEEAFVDSLAEKLMEDAADGAADLDDEDPDMDGWGDLYSDDDKEGDRRSNEDVSDDDEDLEMVKFEDKEMDEKTDDIPELDEIDEESDEASDEELDDEDAFMDAVDSGESDDDDSDDDRSASDEDAIIAGISGQIEGEEDDLAFVDESSDEEDEGEQKKSRKKGKETIPTFADADEYEEMINSSWNALKRGNPEEGEPVSELERKKNKKRRK